MSEPTESKIAALKALRKQLGGQVKSGSQLLLEREGKELTLLTGLGGLNQMLGGGLPRGQITEIIARGPSRGAGVIIAELIAQARREGRYVMLLDIGSGFAIESFPENDLESLLWVGCDSARQAVEALDVATRDENFHLFLVDGRDCEATDWKAIRPALWYRVLNQLRQHDAVAILFSRSDVTAVSRHRLEVVSQLRLDCLHENRSGILDRGQFRSLGRSGAWREEESVLRVG